MNPKRNIPSLDGLRAISILLVIVSHIAVCVYHDNSTTFSRVESVIQMLFLVGHLGVTVFFVISGYLITTLLLKEEHIDVRKFYFRRTLRIFPPYYFYLICVLGVSLAGYIEVHWPNFIAAFTYTRNYFFNDSVPDSWYLAHTWSLAVEEQFYLLLPATLICLGIRRGLAAVALVLLLCPLIRLIYVLSDPTISVEFGRFEVVADSLAVGCMLAGTRGLLHSLNWYSRLLDSRSVVLLPLLALVVTSIGHFPNYYSKPLFVLVAITVQNLSIAIFLDSVVSYPERFTGRLLNARPVAFVGSISYSIYLWQQPFLNPELSISIPLKLLLVITASLFSFYIIERPSLRLRQYLEARKATKLTGILDSSPLI